MITYEKIVNPEPEIMPIPLVADRMQVDQGKLALYPSTYTAIGTMEIYPTVLEEIMADSGEEVWRFGGSDLPDNQRIILEAFEEITRERYQEVMGFDDSQIESDVRLHRVSLGSTDTDWKRPDNPSAGRGYVVHFSDAPLAGRQFALGYFRDISHMSNEQVRGKLNIATASIASMICGQVVEYDHATFQRAVPVARPEPYMMLTATHERIS